MADLRSLLTSYRELLREVDDWFYRCRLAAADQIVCHQGCTACCRGLFDITLLDAFLLRDGFEHLPRRLQERAIRPARQRIATIRQQWPEFSAPYLLNLRPEQEWDRIMPDDDETPCPLLGDDGLCMVYDSRPMTCRLHGVPMVDDQQGEVLFDEWCSLNFTGGYPLQLTALRAPFKEIFSQEQLLFREFTRRLLGQTFDELDTVIPAALFIDFDTLILPAPFNQQAS